MKKRKGAKRLAGAFLLSVGPALSLHAETNVSYSDIVGYQSTSVTPGFSALGFPLVNESVVAGVVSANTTNSINLSGVSSIKSLMNSAKAYYVEVSSVGANEGERFEVDVANTTDAAIAILPSSANNTKTLTSGMLVNASIVLRPHITLSQVQGLFSPALVGNNTSSLADQIILVLNGAPKMYYLRADNTTWLTSGTTSNQANVAIPPGTGILFRKVGSSAVTMTSVGLVRGNSFARNYSSGFQLHAPGFPVSKSPSAIGGVSSNGWVGNNTSASADQIIPFVGGAPKTYYLRSDGSTWLTSGSTSNQASAAILNPDSAFYVKRANSGVFLESKP